ncbi:MAG: hypothetical protein J6V53_03695 [Alphaproteobacteria bacterium]|nr:hypothetical protein [Alphaproteobacteria bacterium]
MVDRQEIDNLDFMLHHGMIDEKTYQCHKQALNNRHKRLHQTNLSLINLEDFSILKAFKFSFSPISFVATFLFLLISSIILVGLFRIIWGRPECLFQLIYFVENKKIQNGVYFYLILSFLYAFWQALWFSFFSYFSFTSVKQVYGPFSFKRYLTKSFLLLLATFTWFSSIVAIWSHFIINVLKQKPGISNISMLEIQHLPITLLYLLIICAISYIFTVILMVLTGPFRGRLLEKAFYRGLKKPFYVIKFWAGVLLNVLIMGILFIHAKNAALPLFKIGYNSLLDIKSLSSFSSAVAFVVIYVLVYAMIPKKHILWFKLSFLFVIPSAIIYSMFVNILSIHSTIIFFFFLHIVWMYFYVGFFFTIQSISFWNNLLTQMWCCTMKGEYVIHKNPKKNKI